MYSKLIILLGLVLLSFSNAYSEIVAECGPQKGYTFIYEGMLIPKGRGGWDTDSTNGSTKIIKENGKFDIVFVDATLSERSTVKEGGTVLPIGFNSKNGTIVLMVMYPGKVAEIYSYNSRLKKLTLLQHKFNQLINKSVLMVSNCE